MARELTETELETIAGGGFWGSVVNFFRNLFAGPGDLRRPLNPLLISPAIRMGAVRGPRPRDLSA
ncbi:ComC/BlpC family leader-containing pheromone/bacteriocin [Bradyrhizobium sp. WSM3983]|uniref:ComC/BlpC family leader-containing pheromone/bacteriocin n=1 Tax=Bradyrhizobium sp. WSM3983 TaxID=1038867 RepID=UPI00040C679A|nr:ComC/BlpC family leader-containing pheromone/bacteriocin [Bradyrhizobium sp. WSM3983]